MKSVRTLGLLAGVSLLAACAQSVGQLNNATATGSPFTQALAAEYRDFANFEAREMFDFDDAELFAQKGLQAANGVVVQPEDPSDWDLTLDNLLELAVARSRLVRALGPNRGRIDFPNEAAIAQARFDCWVEQAEENAQPDHIAACKSEFEAALATLEAAQMAQPEPEPVAPAPPPGPRRTDFLVFFDFDESAITPTALGILQQIARDVQEFDIDGLKVVGHTDTSGSVAYNQALSERRAQAVRDALAGMGVSAQAIITEAFGETQPLVTTPDGVREPSNRRSRITFE